MRKFVSIIGKMVLFLEIATPAPGQVAPYYSPESNVVAPLAEVAHPSSVSWNDSPLHEAHDWSLDFILGLPSGFRLQRSLDSDGLWQIEGFAGLELIFPTSGVGLRRRFMPIAGSVDCLTVSPGVDAYLLYNLARNSGGFFGGGPDFWGLFAADVEISWHHAWNAHVDGEAGIKLGAGVVSTEPWHVLPVAGIFAGWRF